MREIIRVGLGSWDGTEGPTRLADVTSGGGWGVKAVDRDGGRERTMGGKCNDWGRGRKKTTGKGGRRGAAGDGNGVALDEMIGRKYAMG